MSQNSPHNIDTLLQRLGSHEIPGDSEHRYDLRRALLRSTYFEVNRKKQQWSKWLAMSTTIFAGSMMVLVISVGITQMPAGQQLPVSSDLPATVLVSDKVRPAISEFVDDTRSDIRFVDMSPDRVRQDVQRAFEPAISFATVRR